MFNPFEAIKEAQKYIDLANKLRTVDDDGNGIPDAVDYVNDASELAADIEDAKALAARIQKRLDKMTSRFGENIETIKETLGIESPEVV